MLLARPIGRSSLSLALSRSLSSNASSYDVVICGGGLVGSATALAIAKQPAFKSRRILLLEAAPKREYAPPDRPSNRVVALNAASRRMLTHLGVWSRVECVRSKAVFGMQVWDADGGVLDLTSQEENAEPVFHVVENDLVVAKLTELVEESQNVDVSYATTAKDFDVTSQEGEPLRVHVQGERVATIATRVLVGAEGAGSAVRKRLLESPKCGSQYVARTYDQMGVVATLQLGEPMTNAVAWQKFVANSGPVALLPLSSTLSSLVWSQPTSEAKRRLALRDEDFASELRKTLGKPPRALTAKHPLPHIVAVSSRAAFPLGLGHSSRYVWADEGVALVGDAAHRVHPLAGQVWCIPFSNQIEDFLL